MKNDSEKIQMLLKEIEALEKTKKALMNRVERSVSESVSSFSILESNILLQKKVDQRTADLEKSYNEVQQLAKEATQASIAKSEFVANMSHEIRTPMNALLGYIDLLKEKNLDEETNEYINIIADSGRALLTILNDVLDLSRIESGKFELSLNSFNLSDDIRRLILFLDDTATSEKVKLVLNNHLAENEFILGDPIRIRQILMNLLTNAMKFTNPGGEVVLDVSRRGDYVYFKVKDNGIGIDEDNLKMIFDSFSQVESSTTRKFGGTGLGLSITKNLVELMNGELYVTSVLGEGSEFTVSMILPVEEKSLGLKLDEVFTHRFRNKKVLLVEDNLVNQKLMAKYLEKIGIDYTIAENGKEAIEEFCHHSYDLIFMDENMPIMNGIRATLKIREIEKRSGVGKRVPIIAITANAMQEDKKRFFASGMDYYLSKPVSKKQILDVLANVLEGDDKDIA